MAATVTMVYTVMSYLSLALGSSFQRLVMKSQAFTSRFVGLLRGLNGCASFSMFVNSTANIVLKLLRVDPDQTEDEVTEDSFADGSRARHGNIRRDEAEMIKNVFALTTRTFRNYDAALIDAVVRNVRRG